MKEIVPVLQRFQQRGIIVDLFSGNLSEAVHVLIESMDILNRQRFVRSEGGKYLNAKRLPGNGQVMFKRITGIVGRAKGFHFIMLDRKSTRLNSSHVKIS